MAEDCAFERMRSWSIPIGRLFDVDLRLHLAYAFLFAFIYWTEPQADAAQQFERTMALVGIILASVLVHESAHLILSVHYALPVRSVVLLPIGGVSLLDETAFFTPETSQPGEPPGMKRWQREAVVAAAGPVVSFVVAIIAAVILAAVAPQIRLSQRPWIHTGGLMRSIVWVNVFLGAINLLPAYPLDGGRVLRALFTRIMDFMRATRQAVTIGQACSMLLFFAGMWNTWLMMIGFFLFIGAQLEERSVMFQSVLENVRMGDVMLTDFATLSPADTLEDALHKAVHSLQDDFPVIRGTDMVGVISRQNILEALRSEGNSYVQSAMNRAYEVAARSDSLAAAFRKITARGMTLIPVVENERLVGIVTLQNLMHSMSLLAETRRLRRPE
jgi:Zn-dependent protease/CBS domain-containing protein